jgi:hypothetical protein
VPPSGIQLIGAGASQKFSGPAESVIERHGVCSIIQQCEDNRRPRNNASGVLGTPNEETTMRSFLLTLTFLAAIAIGALLPGRASAQYAPNYYGNYAPNYYGTTYYVPPTVSYYYSSSYVPGANYYAPSYIYNPPVYIPPTYNPPVYAPAYYTPQYSTYQYLGRRRGYYFP